MAPSSDRSDGSSVFTGEFMVPGATEQRIVDDHLERYKWAAPKAAGKVVLDIACGAGYGTKLLAESGASLAVGVDLNGESLPESDGSEVALEYHQGDICTFDVGRRRFDLIVCFETIEHVDDYMSALVNLRRLISPGGTLLISSPNRSITSPDAVGLSSRPVNPFHVREFVSGELRAALTDSGFRVDPGEFGQRIQPMIPTRQGRRVYSKVVRPHLSSSPVVRPVTKGTPRYFILVARPDE